MILQYYIIIIGACLSKTVDLQQCSKRAVTFYYRARCGGAVGVSPAVPESAGEKSTWVTRPPNWAVVAAVVCWPMNGRNFWCESTYHVVARTALLYCTYQGLVVLFLEWHVWWVSRWNAIVIGMMNRFFRLGCSWAEVEVQRKRRRERESNQCTRVHCDMYVT